MILIAVMISLVQSSHAQFTFQDLIKFLPTEIEGWANTIGQIAVAVSFIFLILEYKNARKERRSDEQERKYQIQKQNEDELQECDDQYYDILSSTMADTSLTALYDEYQLKESFYWLTLGKDTAKRKIYEITERIYFLCSRVHYLQAKGRIDDPNRWNEWDSWIELLVTSKTFRGVHFDAQSNQNTPDFGKHVDWHIKKLINKLSEKNISIFSKEELSDKNLNEYRKRVESHMETIDDVCTCQACQKRQNKLTY